MANRHFGKAGDVWKHLMLCEVLAALEPTHYAESHAGTGAYDLVHDDERNCGVGHFLEVSSVIETLGASAYAHALRVHSQSATSCRNGRSGCSRGGAAVSH